MSYKSKEINQRENNHKYKRRADNTKDKMQHLYLQYKNRKLRQI